MGGGLICGYMEQSVGRGLSNGGGGYLMGGGSDGGGRLSDGGGRLSDGGGGGLYAEFSGILV